MKKYLRIAVIGGNGRTGNTRLNELVCRGYTVHILLRRSEAHVNRHASAEIVKGNATDAADVHT